MSGRGAAGAYQKEMQPIPEDVICNMDQITIITKLLANKAQFGVTLGEKALRMDINNAKDIRDKIEATFEKP